MSLLLDFSPRFGWGRILALFLLVSLPLTRLVQAGEKDPVVQLDVPDAPAIISALQQQQFTRQAIQLVESSVFTPATPEMEGSYRKALDGTSLLVTLPLEQQIQTTRGPVAAKEILLVLNRKEAVTALFTIDASGKVAAHPKYSGRICSEITKGIHTAVPR